MTRSMLPRPVSGPYGHPRPRSPDGSRDPLRGQPSGDDHRRDADPGCGAAAGQHGVLQPADPVARPERARSARTCARPRTACPRPCPSAAQSAGVTSRDTSMSPATSVEARGGHAPPARPAARRGRPGRRGPSRSGRASRLGQGASTNSRSEPSGASPGSEAVGRVISSDGSLIGRPSSMISLNVVSHALPNEIVWCAASGRAAAQPGVQHDGAGGVLQGHDPLRGTPDDGRCTTGRSGVRTTASQASRSVSSERARWRAWRTAVTRPPPRSRPVTVRP